MPTTVVTAHANSGGLESSASPGTYATARAGSSLSSSTGIDFTVGQSYFLNISLEDCFTVNEGFLRFDAHSVIPRAHKIVSATLSIAMFTSAPTQAFTLQAYARDWGGTLTTADYVAGASLSGLTKVASASTAGIVSGSYLDLTTSNLVAQISRTASTLLLLGSSRTEAGSTPTTTNELVGVNNDTGNLCKLTIVHGAYQTQQML